MIENIDTIVEMRAEGKTWPQIAEAVGCHPMTAYKLWLRETTPKVNVRPTANRVRKDRAKGMGWAIIAARYGTSKTEVKKLYAA